MSSLQKYPLEVERLSVSAVGSSYINTKFNSEKWMRNEYFNRLLTWQRSTPGSWS